MKNSKKIIIAALIVLVAIILIFIFINLKNKNKENINTKIENITGNQAQAQTYVSAKSPSFKDDDKFFGSKKADLKVFVYEDNSSMYSAKLADTLDKLYADNSSKVAVFVRSFIAKDSELSKEAALAVNCAGEQNKWVEMRALLFAQAKNESLSLVNFNKYAEQIGLNAGDFSVCLTNEEKSAKIEGLSEEAEGYNVLGAPAIFIGDEVILGARPYEDYIDSNGDSVKGLKSVIQEKLK